MKGTINVIFNLSSSSMAGVQLTYNKVQFVAKFQYWIFFFIYTGRAFGKDGRFEDWWSESTIEGYTQISQCLVDQYSSYRIPEIDANVSSFK